MHNKVQEGSSFRIIWLDLDRVCKVSWFIIICRWKLLHFRIHSLVKSPFWMMLKYQCFTIFDSGRSPLFDDELLSFSPFDVKNPTFHHLWWWQFPKLNIPNNFPWQRPSFRSPTQSSSTRRWNFRPEWSQGWTFLCSTWDLSGLSGQFSSLLNLKPETWKNRKSSYKNRVVN